MSNTIIENEDLFISLHLMHQVDSEYTKELIKQNYITKSYANTKKAEEFINRFYNSKKELVYNAMKKINNKELDVIFVKNEAGLEEYISIEIIIDRLIDEGKIKIVQDNRYIINE